MLVAKRKKLCKLINEYSTGSILISNEQVARKYPDSSFDNSFMRDAKTEVDGEKSGMDCSNLKYMFINEQPILS